ncbi:hypothetical protein MRX96_032170 [Rhipicephalus microplus]
MSLHRIERKLGGAAGSRPGATRAVPISRRQICDHGHPECRANLVLAPHSSALWPSSRGRSGRINWPQPCRTFVGLIDKECSPSCERRQEGLHVISVWGAQTSSSDARDSDHSCFWPRLFRQCPAGRENPIFRPDDGSPCPDESSTHVSVGP